MNNNNNLDINSLNQELNALTLDFNKYQSNPKVNLNPTHNHKTKHNEQNKHNIHKVLYIIYDIKQIRSNI